METPTSSATYFAQIPPQLEALQANKQHVSELVNYFDNRITTMQPQQAGEVINQAKQYVEDTVVHIASTILDIGRDMTHLLAYQSAELDSLDRRVSAISLRMQAHEMSAAESYTANISTARSFPKSHLKIRKLEQNEIPAISRPKEAWKHTSINLNMLDAYGDDDMAFDEGSDFYAAQNSHSTSNSLNMRPSSATPSHNRAASVSFSHSHNSRNTAATSDAPPPMFSNRAGGPSAPTPRSTNAPLPPSTPKPPGPSPPGPSPPSRSTPQKSFFPDPSPPPAKLSTISSQPSSPAPAPAPPAPAMFGAPVAHSPPPPQQQPVQSSYANSPPPPQQSSYAPPPQQSPYAPPPPQQSSYAPPPPQQSSYAPPPPQQSSYAPPPPQQSSYAPPPPSMPSSPHAPPPSRAMAPPTPMMGNPPPPAAAVAAAPAPGARPNPFGGGGAGGGRVDLFASIRQKRID